jgi:hypothetical protein
VARGGPDAAGGARRCGGGGGGEKEPPDKTISSAELSCLPALLPIKLSAQHCLPAWLQSLPLSGATEGATGAGAILQVATGAVACFGSAKNASLFSMPCYTRNDNFTKTGSGQTYTGKHWKKEAFCAGSEVLWLVGGAQHPPEGTFLHSTAQHSTAQHSTAQHSTSSSGGIAMMTNHHIIIMTSS